MEASAGPDAADSPARGPVALLFGASRGLGLAMARRLAERAYTVVLVARDRDELDRAGADLRARGADVRCYVGDVADRASVDTVVTRVEDSCGPVEVMLCVAGVIQVGPLDAVGREHFEQAIDIMLWGPVHTTLAVLPAMRRRGRGRIGVITSIGGLVPAPHLLPYTTAKFGAVGYSRGLRAELTGSGVSVTTVAPGLMRTGSHRRAYFVGRQGAEYSWFAPAASLPLLSMDADRAADRIVAGVLQGRANVLLTPLTQVASRVAALSPGLTAALLGLTVRLLPDAPGDQTPAVSGSVARERLSPRSRRLVNRLTLLGERASGRFLQ